MRCFVAAAAATCGLLGATSSALAVGDVVISQVWGGTASSTGTSGAPNADYVELFNRTANPISLNGWSLAVDTQTGTTWTTYNLPNVSIQPYSYYLVQVSASATSGNPINADTTFSTTSFSELSSTSGKVALRNVTGNPTAGCPTFDATLVDLVVYASSATSGTCREGTANAPPGSLTSPFAAVFRVADGCVDTDQNGNDFVAMIPSPRNSSSPSTGGCVIGACCNNSTGVCTQATMGGCTSSGGAYQGDGMACSPNPCPPTGACCAGATGSTCSVLTSAGCGAAGGFYQGDGSACSPTPCSTAACCLPDGNCCNLLPALCTSQGGTPSASGVTCTTVGNCTTVPANDLCSGATAISAGTLYNGNNFSATSTGDGLNPLTNTTVANNKSIWFAFTPTVTSVFDIATCGTSYDNVLQVFTIGNCADTSTWSYVAADDDLCPTAPTGSGPCGVTPSSAAALINGVAMQAGTTYYIRLSVFSTSATGGGNWQLQLTDVGGNFGACCVSTTGLCELRSMTGCTSNVPSATYQGDGTTCTPNPCGLENGACCSTGGVCTIRVPTSCTGTNVYQGAGTTCGPNPCVTGACCNTTSGICTVRPSGACTASESYQGDNTVCDPVPCPDVGACCSSTGTCTVRSAGGCTASTSTFLGAGTTCTPVNDCDAQLGACCSTTGSCLVRIASGCTGTSVFQGPGTVCDPNTCPPAGSCCDPCAFTCTSTLQASCTGVWTSGASCSPNPCPPTGLANDEPCGAIALSLGTSVNGNLVNATNTNDGPAGTCQSSANKGVWYSFTPVASGNFQFSTCGSTFDTVLAVFSGTCTDPLSFVEVACDDDACVGGEATPCGSGTASGNASLIDAIGLSAGTTYYIRVQVFGTGTGGTFSLVINSVVVGACCDLCSNTCSISTSGGCGGSFQGAGSTCSPSPCSGTPLPDTCATAQPISGHFVGNFDNSCANNENDEPSDTCNSTTAAGLMNSYWFSFVPGANGSLTGSVTDVVAYDLAGALYSGSCGAANLSLVACWDDPEPWDLAVPEFGSTSVTAGVQYYLVIGDWGTGAGGGLTALDITIPGPVNGACCCGASCTITTAAACTGANRSFAGAGTSCTPFSNTVPCCRGDYNKSGAPATVQDIFDFLAGYFSNDTCADANDSGGAPTVQDIFDFLAAYFGGGC